MLSKESQGRQVLIAVEGPDYAGKSSIISKLIERLNYKYSHYTPEIATSVRRPGGTPECTILREKIVNSSESVMSSLTRQAISLADEVLFVNTFRSHHKVVIFDRYNPISGQIYGPPELKDTWEFAVESGITTRMDAVVFVQVELSTVNSRLAERSTSDTNAIDIIFQNDATNIMAAYEAIAVSPWTQQTCNPSIIHNDGELDTAVDAMFEIVVPIINSKCFPHIDPELLH